MMTGFLFAFCMCVSLNFNSELFLAPYLYVLRSPRISRVRKRKLFSFYSFFVDDDDDSNSCVALHVRIANRLVEDSCCRGGIVHTRCGCSGVPRILRPKRPTALWLFRVSTSNSLSDHSRPQGYTFRRIHQIYAQQDI